MSDQWNQGDSYGQAPDPGYGGYGSEAGYSQPPYGAPPQSGYGAPNSGYGAPDGGYGTATGYGAPGYGGAPGYAPVPTNRYAGYEGSVAPDASPEERQYGMLSHLVFLVTILPGIGWLGGVLAVILMYALKKNDGFGKDQARESLNFFITELALIPLACLVAIPILGWLIAICLIFCLIFMFVLRIVGAVRANNGVVYRYPICLRLIK